MQSTEILQTNWRNKRMIITLNNNSEFLRGSIIVCNTEVGSKRVTGRESRLTISLPINPVNLENNFFLSSWLTCSSFNSIFNSSPSPWEDVNEFVETVSSLDCLISEDDLSPSEDFNPVDLLGEVPSWLVLVLLLSVFPFPTKLLRAFISKQWIYTIKCRRIEWNKQVCEYTTRFPLKWIRVSGWYCMRELTL